MKKTMIYLDEIQHSRLQRLAAEERTSLAELIRRAVNHYLGARTKGPRPRSIGCCEGPDDGGASERVDEFLRRLARDSD